jgi:predicted nucleotidyltransferase component of viral defense system
MNEQALKERIKMIAKEKDISFNECLKKLFLERFLSRLSRSTYASKFIFKGGSLLSYMIKIGRETKDLDFLLTSVKVNEKEIEKAMQSIISEKSNDGFSFSMKKIEILSQPHMPCPGYRTTLNIMLGKIKNQIQIDIGIGDIVNPNKQYLSLFKYRDKPIFEEAISLLVYPPETIFAEKLEAIIYRGEVNSRMKDYHDILLLIRDRKLIKSSKLRTEIDKTFKNRKIIFDIIKFEKSAIANLQKQWNRHIKNLDNIAKELKLPLDINSVIIEINSYVTSI